MLKTKLHRATVTEANLNYTGSITIDKSLLEEGDLLVCEANSGTICLNGAAARLVQPGDEIIIMAYVQMTPEEAKEHKPLVYILDKENKISQKI